MTFADTPLDRVRAYWDARPCNIRHSLLPVGTREYFDEVEARKYRVEPHIPRFAEFERWTGARVLEVGCGIGTDTINFARAGAHVTAVDISARSLELAQRRAEVYGLANRIVFIQADAEALLNVLKPTPYDLIYSFGAIHHTPHPERAMAQITAYTRPGTELRLMVYNRGSWKVLGIWLARFYRGIDLFASIDDLIARYSEAQTGCPVTYTYTRESVRRLVGSAFKVESITREHIFPYRVSDYVEYRYVKALPWSITPGPVFKWLEHQLGWHLCVKAVAR